MAANGDTNLKITVNGDTVVGLGSFHKTLPHNDFGEVDRCAFDILVEATRGGPLTFADVPGGDTCPAPLTNPQAGLAHDRLTRHPVGFSMPPAPGILSATTAAEMTELYWMALARDVSFDGFEKNNLVKDAANNLNTIFPKGLADTGDPGRFIPGIDLPGPATAPTPITPQNVFRMGLPGEELGPLVSQFFIRDATFGTQTIDQKQIPYAARRDYLTTFDAWLAAQRSGKDAAGQPYPRANEDSPKNYDSPARYISTMRDLARFVNKDALHQAYFNATLILLSGGAAWTTGNPYRDPHDPLVVKREAGFGTLGGPHILALVSEVATRALKVVWNQKWQVHLRLRPEAYGGHLHVQEIGVNGTTRPYGLPAWVAGTDAAKAIKAAHKTLLLPMAFTPGSPTHPAYGAGHATVAGACVTVLKAYFQTFTTVGGKDIPLPLSTLTERSKPYGKGTPFTARITGVPPKGKPTCTPVPGLADKLTIEGELNKLASNVALGRSMGGVHWRTDNTRSLILGEALAAQILADITTDLYERPTFTFRTFARKADGEPKKVVITQGRIYVDGLQVDTHTSAL